MLDLLLRRQIPSQTGRDHLVEEARVDLGSVVNDGGKDIKAIFADRRVPKAYIEEEVKVSLELLLHG